MDPQALRDQERRLAAEYGVAELPKACVGEDLQCDDPEDVEYWACVYSELVDFAHRVLESASRWPPTVQDTVLLHVKFRELHLAYWTDRLREIQIISDDPSGGGDPSDR
jgi:hypothetical protein